MNKILVFQKDKNKLKLLLLHTGKKKAFLQDYKEYEIETEEKTPARFAAGGPVRSESGGVEFIKQFVSDNKADSFKTVCFLPLSSVYVRKISFPYRRISKVKKSIRFAIEPHIPIPVENTKVFFHPIHAKNNNLEVMSFVIPENVLNEHLGLINSAQLICNEIYLAPLSLFNLFSSYVEIKENILWLDVEEDSTYVFCILKNGKLADLRQIPVGRKDITEERTQFKREISTVLLSQGFGTFEDKITEIYISGLPVSAKQAGLTIPTSVGKQASSPEIRDWLTESFNIPVKSIEFNNLLSVERPERPEADGRDSNFIPEILYASYGRNGPPARFRKAGGLTINFSPPVLQEKEKKGIRISCFLVIFALLALSFRLQFERSIYERRFNRLSSRIEKIFLETFPDAKDTRTPLLQMKSRLKSLKDSVFASGSLSSGIVSPIEALREISQRLDKNLQVVLDSFRLKDESISISGNALSYQDIDKIKGTLENSPLFSKVDIESAQTTDKGVVFRLKISPAFE